MRKKWIVGFAGAASIGFGAMMMVSGPSDAPSQSFGTLGGGGGQAIVLGQQVGYRPANGVWPGFVTADSVDNDISVGANAVREFFSRAHETRIMQTGTAYRLKLYFGTTAAVDTIQVRFWRYDGTKYDLIGTTGNIKSLLTENALNTITLSTAVAGIQCGDYYSIKISNLDAAAPGSNQVFCMTRDYNPDRVAMMTSVAHVGSNFGWDGATATSTTGTPQVQVYMVAPQILFDGYSIMAGRGNGSAAGSNYQFSESVALTADHTATAMDSTIEAKLATMRAFTAQNLSMGGTDTSALLSRFNRDVTSRMPAMLIFQFAGGDALTDLSSTTVRSNVNAIIDSCQAHNIIPMVVFGTGHTDFTDEQCDSMENYRVAVENLCLEKTPTSAYRPIYLNISGRVGLHATGPAGNLWNNKYNAGDNRHYLSKANFWIATLIHNKLNGDPTP